MVRQYSTLKIIRDMEMDESNIESLTNGCHDSIYRDHEIYIQPDRDPHRGGFEWSVCRAGVELDSGLDFSIVEALKQAKSSVDALLQTDHPPKCS